MHRVGVTLLLAALLVGGVTTACIKDLTGILAFESYTQYGQTTEETAIPIQGRVIRNPPDVSQLITVTVTGGAQTAVDTANGFGLFDVTVPLLPATVNHLRMFAEDEVGTVSDTIQIDIEQVPRVPAAPPWTADTATSR